METVSLWPLSLYDTTCMLHSVLREWSLTYLVNVCYVDCQEEIIRPPKIFICERWKSTNQAAIRGLKPHEIFSLNASRCRTLRYEVFGYPQHLPHGHLVRCFCRSTVHRTIWLLETILSCDCTFLTIGNLIKQNTPDPDDQLPAHGNNCPLATSPHLYRLVGFVKPGIFFDCNPTALHHSRTEPVVTCMGDFAHSHVLSAWILGRC